MSSCLMTRMFFAGLIVLVLSACAPKLEAPVNKSLFVNETDFHITELTHNPAGYSAPGTGSQRTQELWLVLQEGFKLPAIQSPAVSQQALRLSSGRRHLQQSFDRASLYLFYVVQELNARGMPLEIALIPFIESSYSPLQKGTLHHAGIWGLMPSAGKHLKLKQNAFIDERRDILRSTQGALDYLQEFYAMYGDWQLAIVAYNWGPGNVSRLIAQAKAKKSFSGFESLSFPKAVKDYLIWIAAYKKILANPGEYGLSLPALDNFPYFVVIDVTRDIDISVVLELADISKDEFLQLNPSFNKSVILSSADQKILLPYINAEKFQNNLKVFSKPLTTWKQTVSPLPAVRKNK